MRSKRELRDEVARKRGALDPQWIATASARLVGMVQELVEFRNAQSIALYKAIAGEVDLDALFPLCWKEGKRTCMPFFNRDAKIYELADITERSRFKAGHYGIREPESSAPVPCREVDLMLVPGVAFDPFGNRLGRGGGYYDRLLGGFNGVSVAVAFDFQLYPDIPHDAHDIPVDLIVTEIKVVKAQNEH